MSMEIERTQMLPMAQLAELICLQTENGGTAALMVTGSSMMPMLYHRRDSVMLMRPAGPFKKGQIILYKRDNGRYVLHRIIKVTEDHYVCCGDNQADREIVAPRQVLAVVVGFQRKGRTYRLTHPLYRMYTFLWVELFWLRPPYIKLRRALGRLRKQFRKK